MSCISFLIALRQIERKKPAQHDVIVAGHARQSLALQAVVLAGPGSVIFLFFSGRRIVPSGSPPRATILACSISVCET